MRAHRRANEHQGPGTRVPSAPSLHLPDGALRETLRRLPYFSELDSGVIAELSRRVRQRLYRPGDQILLEGEPSQGFYFVITGRVKVFKVSARGKEQVLRVLGPGRTFNDVPLFDGGPNPASVEAFEPTVVGIIPRAEVLSLIETSPRVAGAVIRVLASRLRALTVVVEDLAFRSVVARVAKLLLDCARGEATLVEAPAEACARLTQQQIAAMTGSVREVVQRVLKILEREGAIKLGRAKVTILDISALEHWSQSPETS